MIDVPPDLRLSVRQVSAPARPALPVVDRPWLFALWMAAASAVAVFAGLVLGVLAVAEVSLGADRWTQSVQAHGRLQLFGFAAPFIVALAFEFMPRLLGRPPFPAGVRLAVPLVLALGALLLAAGQVWHEEVGFLTGVGTFTFLAATLAFAFLVWRVPLARPARIDVQPFYLRAAASWLVVAAALSAWATADSTLGIVALDDSAAVVETFLRGFVMLTIMGIAIRAFVGHLGLEPLGSRQQLIVLATLNAGILLWLAGQGFGPLDPVDALSRAGDAVHAAGILLFTAWFGILNGLRRPTLTPRYAFLIPVAWLGAVVYAVGLLGTALFASAGDLNIYQEGAVRHTFLMGFMIPLMIAMAHVVLARFATGVVPWEWALTLAFWLLLAAWPLRVLPALGDAPPSSLDQALLVIAGVVAMVGLALVAAVSARTALLIAGRHGSPPRTLIRSRG